MQKVFVKYLIFSILIAGAFSSATAGQVSAEPGGVTFRETVWIRTDRSLYLSGEEIPYRATLLEFDTYQPSKLSRYIKIELLSSEGYPITRQTLQLVDSNGSGKLKPGPDVPTGWYFIRAYTNWMRNFSTPQYPLVPVRIVNPGDSAAYPRINRPVDPVPGPRLLPTLSVIEKEGFLEVGLPESFPQESAGVKILVHRTSTWYWFDRNQGSKETVQFRIPIDRIPSGIVQISLFSASNSLIACRLWSDYQPLKHNVQIRLSTHELGLRQECHLEWDPPSVAGDNPFLYDVSVVAVPPDGISRIPVGGLPGWPANAEIPGSPDHYAQWLQENQYDRTVAESFFPGASELPIDPKAANLPDLTHPGIKYFPEIRSQLLCGQVIDLPSNRAIPGTGVGITLINSNGFEACRTNDEGQFFFALPDTLISQDYLIGFLVAPDSLRRIQVYPEFEPQPVQIPKLSFYLTDSELAYLDKHRIIRQINNIYTKKQVRDPEVIRQSPIGLPFYHPADRVIYTDRYIELANVMEVVYEVVPDVIVHRRGNTARLSVYSDKSYSRDYETLILLDGIPVTNQQELLELPPDRIERIEVRNTIYIHGKYIFAAIVNFISRNRDFAGLQLPELSIPGSHPPFQTTSPDNQEQPCHTGPEPLFNNTLLWRSCKNSSEKKFSFFTNDLPGHFRILITGFDQKGQWFSGQAELRIH